MNKVIDKAISICGSRKKLAEACNVSEMAVSLWLRGGGINGKYVTPISKATNGKVSEKEILNSLTEN
ncbi:YdaS family helix-turn-helix protein [Pasteurella multocida]|uniref:YdaS family helix-turn-helix protein n=1 Tax=Pasteurella multocida TaxID=747 RepID=UPI0003530067|nr:YdaS family helix-turn-helix protein [Pasteurella multocida]EPE63841.1 phage transcriptional regulatory protein/antirepressor Cro [Pasteurella multocida P1933]MCL7838875.1 helix-turn-helix domain-containing protein [Pasteurella multocida]MCL7843384.1 helix-turn-helix domain-containing protein [Pasteurella multocida]MCL7845803.1 helix-turn-helix domain-containing protein [Pasteurella multocida]MDC4238434.1 helix-turn-helix domain-containing protein [Pasteurella multocida]